ncbi:MAG: type II toxin-antitoxin system RelE/ParE family toxin [Nitrospiraceae bacterium]|nr:type II toxin-antitoxin system RelE/ParE family toxin [Nitrospiraceae bacterium]
MRYEVRIDDVAADDLFAIYRYAAVKDSPAKAAILLAHIEKVMSSLEDTPARGNCPPELRRWGILDFREVFFKPFRIIYEISGGTVFIHAVLDGRRNCEELLQQRLLGA